MAGLQNFALPCLHPVMRRRLSPTVTDTVFMAKVGIKAALSLDDFAADFAYAHFLA
ncbi:hypothetical protein B6N60_02778 [Richelia sinica FACHB-800]|uniref:Uncharacterized protein n=1 Tax=Richelia sinica FACHB-800 TaxID=1357546 RepID=A0A975Y5B8_9NOST|nr:hypothetical protein [Richelia sinica]MBD2665395.1 hypothetical protein [Richelia sinica FACHB-800]QXE24075.1 hypothetical protein B6N60_02778 [Richelia sinica FACHB-800]